MKAYKTVFIPIDSQKSSMWTGKVEELNGDAISRELQAAINEKVQEGYRLHSMEGINSTALILSAHPTTFTSGFMLVFEKENG